MSKGSKRALKLNPDKPMTINQMIALFRRIIESAEPSSEHPSQSGNTP